MRFVASLVISSLSSVIGISGAIAASNPTQGGVAWMGSQFPSYFQQSNIGIWNSSTGEAKGFSPTPGFDAGDKVQGFGKFGADYKYIVRRGASVVLAKPGERPFNGQVVGAPAVDWQIGGTADFDKDGVTDIAWRNNVTGDASLWLMNANGTVKQYLALPGLADTNYKLVGVGDFDGDGNIDMLWHHKSLGILSVWKLNAAYGYTNWSSAGNYGNATFDVKDAGNFDGVGFDDILLHNKVNNTAIVLKNSAAGFTQQVLAGQDNVPAASNVPAGSPAQVYAPTVMLKAPINAFPFVTSGGPNTRGGVKDLGVLTATSNLAVQGLRSNSLTVGPFDNYYKFTVAPGSSVRLSIGIANPKISVNVSSIDGAGSPFFTPNGGGTFTTSFAPGVHYLRAQNAQDTDLNTTPDYAPYTLTISPASPPPINATALDPGTESSNIISSVRSGGSTYMLIDGGKQSGLWKTDGTAAGTTLVKAGAPAANIVANGATLYFAMDGADSKGAELWKSDGTAAGTVRVADINTQNNGADGSKPGELIVFNGLVYFVADDGVTGSEVWKSDGTAAGTTIAANINTATGKGSDPTGLTVFDGSIVFSANDGINGREAWRLTNGATVMISNGIGSANPQEFTVAGSNLFYTAATGGQDASGADLDVELVRVNTGWVTAKQDILAGGGSSNPSSLIAWGNDLYFSAIGGQGRELFRANATTFNQVADIFTGTTGATQNSSNPGSFAIVNSKLVFAANDGVNGREVWAYNGSTAPTRVSQIAPGVTSASPTGLTTVNGSTYFSATASGDNFELYKTDGVTASLVKEINTGNNNADPSIPYGFVDGGNGKAVFSAFTNAEGFEPWVTDGTASGTTALKDVNTSPREGIGQSVSMGGWNYFPATDKDRGRELYRTNGVITELVSDIVPGVGSSNPSNLTAAGNFVYFSATTPANGTKLWRSDGVTTAIVGNINATGVSDNISNVVATTNGDVFVTGADANGLSLRRVNGGVLTEVKNFGAQGYIAEMTALGNNVFLSASDRSGTANQGLEPWRVTAAGAVSMGDLNPGDKSSNPYEFVRTDNNDIYFAATTEATGYELWRSVGGTAAPTQVVSSNGGLMSGAGGSNITKLTALGNEVFFAAYSDSYRDCTSQMVSGTPNSECAPITPNFAPELRVWRTDGTEAGTFPDFYLSPFDRYNFSPKTPAGKPELEYEDYLGLMAVNSSAGKSVYTTSRFGSRVSMASNGASAHCNPIFFNNPVKGREIRQSFPRGEQKHKNASRPTEYGPRQLTVGLETGLWFEEAAISVDRPNTCNEFFGSPYLYSSAEYDSRLSGHEDVVLGNINGVIYMAGWKSDATANGGRYEVWSMLHSEAMTTRYNADGGVDTRVLTSIGNFGQIERATLEFVPNGTQMLMKGYNTATKKWEQWKI